VVFSVALGIAVDDTIHVLARVRELLRAGRGPDEAVVEAIATTGRALATTSLLLGGAFATFAVSDFPIPRVFGSLMATAIGTAFALDVTLLPALLALGARFGRGSGGQRAEGAHERGGGGVDVGLGGAAAEAQADRAARDVIGDA